MNRINKIISFTLLFALKNILSMITNRLQLKIMQKNKILFKGIK